MPRTKQWENNKIQLSEADEKQAKEIQGRKTGDQLREDKKAHDIKKAAIMQG